jgi:hypothetical protein
MGMTSRQHAKRISRADHTMDRGRGQVVSPLPLVTALTAWGKFGARYEIPKSDG